ncbi:unnamed protein product, partial [Allacma fusca]
MALKLEDLLNKKKEPGSSILDLSKIKIKSKEEFEKYYDKIPEFKIRPEKVRYDDYRMRDTDFSFTFNKKEAKNITKHEFTYADPIPASMRSVRLEDLAAVDINWRMLTMARPNNKLEEDIFSRIVELGKLRLNTQKFEAKVLASTANAAPGSQSNATLANMGIIVSKNKRGVT